MKYIHTLVVIVVHPGYDPPKLHRNPRFYLNSFFCTFAPPLSFKDKRPARSLTTYEIFDRLFYYSIDFIIYQPAMACLFRAFLFWECRAIFNRHMNTNVQMKYFNTNEVTYRELLANYLFVAGHQGQIGEFGRDGGGQR